MNNKTIKVAIAALAIVTIGSVRPNAQASDGSVAQTKPLIVNCCSTGGMTATSSGTCSCTIRAGDVIETRTPADKGTATGTGSSTGTTTTPTTPPSTPVTPRTPTSTSTSQSSIYDQLREKGGRARGDVVRLKGTSKGKLSTTAAGEIQVPQVGSVYEYQYGKITLVIGSFSVRDQSLNPKVDNMMREIIAAAAKDPRINTMVWYGRRLAGSAEVVEIGESFTNATDLSNVTVQYQPKTPNSFTFTTPKNVGAETFLVDLNPILKK